jgi:hypothetical protein
MEPPQLDQHEFEAYIRRELAREGILISPFILERIFVLALDYCRSTGVLQD